MKFLNINDIKLKVILTSEDCKLYGIDPTAGDYSTREIRQAVREILAVAERECGFSAEGEKILVQAYPIPDGNCELLVTRLGVVSRRDKATLSSADGLSLMERKRGTYRFSSADDVRSAVRATRREGVVSDLYRDDLGRYYIHTEEEFTDGVSEFEVFVEYGERLGALPIAVLSEYGTLLTKDNAFDYVLSKDFKSV